jgi:hypothetical protein
MTDQKQIGWPRIIAISIAVLLALVGLYVAVIYYFVGGFYDM